MYFAHEVLGSHPWKSRPDVGLSTRLSLVGALIACVVQRPILIVGGWNSASFVLMYVFAIVLGLRCCIWTDTPSIKRRGLIKKYTRGILLWFLGITCFKAFGTGDPACEELRRLGFPLEKISSLRYSIDVSMFRHESLWTGVSVNLVCVARLHIYTKGLDTMLYALRRAKEVLPHVKFTLSIVGDGPDRAELESLVSELDLDSSVMFLGWMEAKEVCTVLARCHGLVLASRSEPYGVVLLEGMASSLCVMASDSCGCAIDLLRTRQNGLVHPTSDSDALSRDIVFLATRPEEARSLGVAARRDVMLADSKYVATAMVSALGNGSTS